MRRSALILALVASAIVPLQAMGTVDRGCGDVRAASSCCCPASARDAEGREHAKPTPSVESVCCCEIQPAAETSKASLAAAAPSAPLPEAGPQLLGEAPSPDAAPDEAHSFAPARAPPEPSRSLFSQHIALLL